MINAVYYIKNHFAQDISLPDIAAYAGVHPNYLSKCFRENTGVSVRDYITQERLKLAQKMLTESDQRIVEIAEAVGIHDPRYFAQVFRHFSGLTPAAYRKQNRTGQG